MNLSGACFLADVNIHPDVIAELRRRGWQVESVVELGMANEDDPAILTHAAANDRVVVTHDRDFGRHAVAGGMPVYGILYLRRGISRLISRCGRWTCSLTGTWMSRLRF